MTTKPYPIYTVNFAENFPLDPPYGGQNFLPAGDYLLAHSGGPNPGDFNVFDVNDVELSEKLATVGLKIGFRGPVRIAIVS